MLICKGQCHNLMFDSDNGDGAITFIYDAAVENYLEGNKKMDRLTVCLCPFADCYPQKLLVGDFPHELEVDEMEEDVPKRKNRTKARVGCNGRSIA